MYFFFGLLFLFWTFISFLDLYFFLRLLFLFFLLLFHFLHKSQSDLGFLLNFFLILYFIFSILADEALICFARGNSLTTYVDKMIEGRRGSKNVCFGPRL